MHDSRYSWIRLGVTLAIATVGNVGLWLIIMLMPAVQAEFGVSRGEASLPFTGLMIGFAVGNLVIGRWVDRWGVTTALVIAGLCVSAGLALSAVSGGILILCAAQALVGFATAASFGPLMADISHWFMKRRGIAVGIAASGNYMAGVVWPLLMTGVLEESGWRTVFGMMAVIVPACVLPLALFLRRKLPDAEGRVAAAAAAARVQTVQFSPRQLQVMLMIAGIGCCMAMSMPQVHIVALCTDLGYGPAVGAEMLSLMLLGGVASRLISGFLADWLGGVRTVLLGSFGQCIALFLYLPFDGLISLYVVSMVFGLSQGGIVPGYAVIVREYMPPKEAGARVGVVMMATVLGMALGGWMSGWIYDLTGSYTWAFLNGIAWNFLNMGILLTILFRGRGRPAAAVA